MKRLVVLIVKLAVILAFVAWLADRPGKAHIVWHGYAIDTSASVLALGVLGIALVFFLLFRIWHFIRNGPSMWRLRRKISKLREGQQQLTEGLIAIAAGNAAEAGKHAVGARKLLGTTSATRLLQAQAAQLAGDRATAKSIFLTLAAEPESAVLGYRGLIMEALRARDFAEAEKLVEKLRRLRPETPWLNLIRFELAARRQAWDEAGMALDQAATARLMDPQRARRNQAAVLLAGMQDEARQGHPEQALQAAEHAARLAPDWLPAAIALARQQMACGHKRAAHRTIERAWRQMPHPQLLAAYRSGNDGDAGEAYKQVQKLCGGDETLPLNRLALGEAALDADIWGEARRHLLALTSHSQATQKAYRLLARLERRESNNESAAAQWLTRAIDVPSDPVWLCRTCGGGQEEWQALCRYCGAFDALEWQTPGQSSAQESGGRIQGFGIGELIAP